MAKQTCPHFLKGRCTYGDKCKFRHDVKAASKIPSCKPCHYFGTRPGCYRGQQCLYSHEANTGDAVDAQRRPPKTERTELENAYREWTFLIPRDQAVFYAPKIDVFFRTGWDLVCQGHAEINQQVIKKLATEEGLGMIKRLVDAQCRDGLTSDAKSDVFKKSTLPFLRILSTRDILSSLILEAPLDTISTYLFGPNGRRALPFFEATASALALLAQDKENGDEEVTWAAVTANLIVLERIVELNQQAQVMTEFVSIVTSLVTTIPDHILQSSKRSITRIQQRLGVGESIPAGEGHLPEQDPDRPIFQLSRELPGALLEGGPRHDNDHEDISRIQILPTSGEIQSSRLEYHPSIDPAQNHLQGLAGLLDRQFRLLREDTVGQVRDAVQIEHQLLLEHTASSSALKRRRDGVRTNVYENVSLHGLEFSRNKGLQFVAEFDQPRMLVNKGAKEREEWWNNSKQLLSDAFLCLVSSTGRALFFAVTDPVSRPPPPKDQINENKEALAADSWRTAEKDPLITTNVNRKRVTLSLVEDKPGDITWINDHIGKIRGVRQSLVEFPGILVASFRPTLQALQKMSQTLDLPFSPLLVPGSSNSADIDIPPPAYSKKPGFAFRLDPLVGGAQLTLRPGQPFDDAVFREHSSLDDAQRRSIVNALSSCVALIQGPPGTGKTYTGVALIKALLRNRKAARLGPVICVCYTNHALDQLLEHLIEDGVQKVLRLGSRSKSEVLQELNLHHVAKGMQPTKFEGYEKYLLYDKLDEVLNDINMLMPGLRDPGHWSKIRDYLSIHHKGHFRRLFGQEVDEDGFREARGRKFNPLNSWIKGAPQRIDSNRPVADLLHGDLMTMSTVERLALHLHWVKESTRMLNTRFLHLLASYKSSRDSLKQCRQEVDLRCLLDAHVIGVTTTGLARNLDLLRRVQAKVLVVEEAGEVLEAHTLTAILPSIEHAILIGDHEQLRPQINKYEFQHDSPHGNQVALDISLFERLINPRHGHTKMPYSSLEIQRRMHPSIAELIRSTLYPKLQDHLSVSTYPDVDGMRNRLYWFDHSNREDETPANVAQSSSKTNAWEVEMTAAVVTHLVRQGTYGDGDIAVLTPYLGQLQKLKRRLRESFAIVVGDRDIQELDAKGLREESETEKRQDNTGVQKTTLLNAIRIATVDNFQGEEAKVIVISLVRSNAERKCGFLKTSNRINVLLSRARHGMYIIGNAHTARVVPMWEEVITILENNGNLGQSLALCCPRHKETPIEVSDPDAFSISSPEGGCQLKCTSRLLCGHACVNKCHSRPLHDAVRCLERCQRPKRGCDHACQKVCGDPCDLNCQTKIPNVTLPCGHVCKELACHLAQHPEIAKCKVLLEVKMPGCGHSMKVRCHQLPLAKIHPCEAVCAQPLECGHKCQQKCDICNKRNEDGRVVETKHPACKSPCGRLYNTCGHICTEKCHGARDCRLCVKPCEVYCSHSRCDKKCHEPCAPCVENCTWSCPHRGACHLPCAVPCDKLPCSKRCTSKLSCGHQCPSICGEPCPEVQFCQECAGDATKDMMVDYIMASTYREINLDESPCIFPSCGHFLTLESMDGLMDMSKYYVISSEPDAEEPITALKSGSKPFDIKDLKDCPLCRSPLRNINRYGRIIRRAWIDEATKKFIVWANAEFVPLTSRLDEAEANLRQSAGKRPALKSSRDHMDLATALEKLSLDPMRLCGTRNEQDNLIYESEKKNSRYRRIFPLRSRIQTFLNRVSEAEQPIGRIHSMIEDARRHRGIATESFDIPSVLQVRHRLLAIALLLRCDYAILHDYVSHTAGVASAGNFSALRLDLTINRKDCESLVEESRACEQPAQQVEGLLFFARFAALERGRSAKLSEADMTELIKNATAQVENAKTICISHPGSTRGLLEEVSAAETMLRESTFYAPVSNAERAAVYVAMAQDFSGTGHWYYCINRHPFTVGECGLPMQTSVCPQCGAAVGGSHHQAVEGVTRAGDMEEQFGRGR